jgi:hypothetical protein
MPAAAERPSIGNQALQLPLVFLFRVVHDVDLVVDVDLLVSVEGKENVSGAKAAWSQ